MIKRDPALIHSRKTYIIAWHIRCRFKTRETCLILVIYMHIMQPIRTMC